jgi:hypothetical protein
LSPSSRQANIDEELTQAGEALRAAEALVALGLYRDAANRLYYAAYHATRALLLTASDYTRGFVMPEEECRAELVAAQPYLETVRAWLAERSADAP